MPLLPQGRRGSSKGKNMSEPTPKINVKTLPQTERCFLDERLEDKAEYTSASMLWGERFSLQVGIQLDRPQHDRTIVFMSVESEISALTTDTTCAPSPDFSRICSDP